jgi:hypothetical protein
MRRELWYCPLCPQNSTRHGNLKIHIERKHPGMGEPIRRSGLTMPFAAEMNFPDNRYSVARNQPVYPYPSYSLFEERNKSFDGCLKVQQFAEKLVKLKTVLSKFHQQDVQNIILVCKKVFEGSGDTCLLDEFLRQAPGWVKFRDTVGKLGFPETNQQMSKLVSQRSFMRPLAASSSYYHTTPQSQNIKHTALSLSSPNQAFINWIRSDSF